jgi:hypothetical protein
MAIDVSFTMVDDYARVGVKRFEGVATTLAQAQTDATALMTDLAAVTLCGASKRTFSQGEALSEGIETGANIDAGGTLHVRLNNSKQHAIKIPAIDPQLVNADGSIDIGANAIIDFVANFEQAGPYRLSEGNYVVALLYGELDR